MSSIYLYNAMIKDVEEKLDKDQAYYLTRLINFRNENNVNEFSEHDYAQRLLEVINKNPEFEKVGRVCIALHLPLSNRIQVISSAIDGDSENMMEPGYACFVSPNTSLNDIGQGDIRTYSNVDEIIDSYIEQDRPVQRSIYYLKKMGFKSGITLKLRAGQGVEGYIFLNSTETNYFDTKVKDNSIYLNVLEMVALDFFQRATGDIQNVSNLQAYVKDFPRDLLFTNIHQQGEQGVMKISTLISKNFDRNISIDIDDKTETKSLLPWGQISLIITFLLKDLGATDLNHIFLTIEEVNDEVLVHFKGEGFREKIPSLSFDHYRAIRKFCMKVGMELIATKDSFHFKVPVDYASKYEGVDYSVNSAQKSDELSA